MYRGYELLTWENRLVDVGARRIRKFHQTELEIRLCRVMKRIISQALQYGTERWPGQSE